MDQLGAQVSNQSIFFSSIYAANHRTEKHTRILAFGRDILILECCGLRVAFVHNDWPAILFATREEGCTMHDAILKL
jgi:hypothetical protein